MLILLSPAKSLDYETPLLTRKATQPRLAKHSFDLVEKLKTFFKKENIFRAYNFTEAVNYMESEKINILFTDISMPSKNGMDFIIDFIKKRP